MLFSQVDLLEQGVLRVLGYAQSIRNEFAPINRIPVTVLSLIPKYLDAGVDVITLTHVCRGWRRVFISCASLWTRLDFANVNKTRTYVERSKSLPLEIFIIDSNGKTYSKDAFQLAAPHVKRFKSLTIGRTSESLRNFTTCLPFLPPLLEELILDFTCNPAPSISFGPLNENLPSLRTLKLAGILTNLPWKNLRNLTTFELRYPKSSNMTVTRLLDFLENAPHLRNIMLQHSIPPQRKASPSRVVHLRNLINLTIIADQGNANFLNHLSIPELVSLTLEFGFSRTNSPLPKLLPEAKSLENLFRFTTVNLLFARNEKFLRLVGPGGELCILGHWGPEGGAAPSFVDLDGRILHSLPNCFSLHTTQRLTVTEYTAPTPGETDLNRSPVTRTLIRMANLRALQLIQCNNLVFIFALNPNSNSSRVVPCPNLEELVLYVEARDAFNIPQLMNTVKERALRGAKLRSVTIVGLRDLVPGKEVFKLREHVPHVEYRFEESPPKWDSNPDDAARALELRRVQPSRARDITDVVVDGGLTFEQKNEICEAMKTLRGVELDRAIQIIHDTVPEIRNVSRLPFFFRFEYVDC